MKKSLSAIPNGYHSITPYLIVNNALHAIEFYKKIFHATEIFCMKNPDGKIGHAELKIGDSTIMLADEFPEMECFSPKTLGGSPIGILLYLEDVDTVTENAVKAGAEIIKPLENKFYGDRSASIKDPFGHNWTLATHIEDVTEEEMTRRAKEFFESQKSK